MKNQTQVVVIGGGLIGCSILYHLTKLGWRDVVLLERSELTAGSTWHAAANVHGLHDNNNISRLQYYSMQLYKKLEQETEQGCGIFTTGALYLAQTESREHQLRIQQAKAKYFGVDFYEISIKEAQQKHPLVNYDGIRCVMYEPDGGSVDPSGVTHAYAKGARMAGANIYQHTPVTATTQRSDGSWDVSTPNGNIHTEVVVNAAGLWGREVAQMAGFELPLMTMEHQYFVTENIAELDQFSERLPSVSDRDGEYYLRQEGNGLLVGAYERDGRFWAEQGTPQDFGHELLPDDLERISDNVMRACERVPVLGSAGIKRVINGPMIWSPDGNALFGPVPELKNYYCCNGIIPGFSQSGGLGSLLAQWIVEGETELDMFPWDLARYGQWANNKTYVKARALDSYSHRFKIHFPYEERETGRAVRKRPIYEMQQKMGAVFGLNYGWEHPLWFTDDGNHVDESYGFGRQNSFDYIARECVALREKAGLIDISNFAKYEVKGKGAGDWLDKLVANRVPREIGRSCLAPLLGLRGGIAGDFTITMLAEDCYLLIGSGMAERYHQRFFDKVDKPATLSMASKTEAMVGFNLAGPMAREVLQPLTDTDLSNQTFAFMCSKSIKVAGINVIALRVSFTGDLGWELHCDEADQQALYTALLDAGKQYGILPVGSRSLLSLRIEKGYGSWGREYSPEYWPHEVGLDGLIKLDKPEFLGRDAYIANKDKPARWQLVMLEIDADIADASGGEPIFTLDGEPCGQISSGAYSHSMQTSLAMGFIKAPFLDGREDYSAMILGKAHSAKLLQQAKFDPQGLKLRS